MAKEGDRVILQYYVGLKNEEKRLLRATVTISRGRLLVHGKSFYRTGKCVSNKEPYRILEPTDRAIREFEETESKKARLDAEKRADQDRLEKEKAEAAAAAADWMRTEACKHPTLGLVEMFSQQVLRDLHEELVRKGRLKPTEKTDGG